LNNAAMTEIPAAQADAVSAAAGSPRLPPAVVWAVAAVLLMALATDAWWPEGRWSEALFATAMALTIVAAVMVALPSLLAAVILTGALLAMVRTVSELKRHLADLPLHAYDLFAALTSSPSLAPLWRDYPGYALAFLAGLAVAVALAIVARRVDGTRLRRRHALIAVPCFALLAWFASVANGERVHSEIFSERSDVAFFFSSWAETLEALRRGHVMEAAARSPDGLLRIPATCQPASKPPHIILIHEESVVQPSEFPSLRYDKSLDPFFRSHDGRLHRLRVETYGGASWLTEFSVLTGLSAQSSGGIRNFVQSVMAGKVRDTLPQALARCGYRNVAVYPMLRIFLSIDRFFTGAGIHEILDAKDQRAKWPNERDNFYFGNALAALERHLKVSQQPMFAFIETMATHGSYDFTYMPEENVPGGGPGTPPHMHEYLRRLALARIDYNALRAELDRRFPSERFLIVHYGDHHPAVTRPFLGFTENTSFEEVMRSGNDAAFITYYAVDGVRYAAPPLPAADVLDVAYLGTVILEAAGLPLSDLYRERKRLMVLCEGRYQGCPAPGEIPNLHRRMIDSGLMDAL
jgi:phosphoglycerol transferase MdoB-like AlkP superfamily enzyme